MPGQIEYLNGGTPALLTVAADALDLVPAQEGDSSMPTLCTPLDRPADTSGAVDVCP
jgi:hypothetical protein